MFVPLQLLFQSIFLFVVIVEYMLIKMSELRKFPNKLIDEELLVETNDYDSDFNDLLIENRLCDIEGTDIVTETDDVDEVL